MKAVVHRILENNLDELKGLSIEGEIPLTEEFLNDLIGLYLADNTQANTNSQQASSSFKEGIDFSQILNSLDTKELKIELKEKIAIIKINAKKF
jgi:hypothetical protein